MSRPVVGQGINLLANLCLIVSPSLGIPDLPVGFMYLPDLTTKENLHTKKGRDKKKCDAPE